MKHFFRSLGSLTVCLVFVSTQVEASWFSDFTGVNIDVAAGTAQIGPPNPGAIQRLPQVISQLPQDLANLINVPGAVLALAIRNAKAQALNGARPVPPYIRQKLQPYVPMAILDSVRVNINIGRLALNSAVMLLKHDVEAVTLDDVIVFDTEEHLQTDYITWAHELTHVQQYRDRGVETFANTYVTNSWVLENEAYTRAASVAQQLNMPPPQSSLGYSYYGT